MSAFDLADAGICPPERLIAIRAALPDMEVVDDPYDLGYWEAYEGDDYENPFDDLADSMEYDKGRAAFLSETF